MARLQLSKPQTLQAELVATRIHPSTHQETDHSVLRRGTTLRREVRGDVPDDVEYVIFQTEGRRRWIVNKSELEEALVRRTNGVAHWTAPPEAVAEPPSRELSAAAF